MAEVTKRVASVFVDDAQAAAALKRLQNEAQHLQKRLNEVPHGSKDFKQIEQRLVQVQRNMRALNQEVQKSEGVFGKLNRQMGGLATAFVGFFAASKVVGILGEAGRIVQDFDAAQSNLAAIMGTSKEGIRELTEEAKRYGATTAFTATQVTELQTELGKLGFTQKDIQQSTGAVLDLAAATGTDLANAATIAAQTLNAFQMSAGETQRIVDVIAQSANLSAFDIDTFSAAMSNAAPAAKSVGVEVEQTAALLSALVDAGIPAEKAGTDIRNIFIALAKEGKTMDQAFEEIRGSTNQLTTAVQMFDQRSAGSAIILAENTEKLQRLEESYKGAAGAAAEMAKTQLDNLKGDKLLLQSAWEGFVLSVEDGSGIITKGLRAITQVITDIFDGLTKMNERSGSVANFTEQVEALLSAEDRRRIAMGSDTAQKVLNEYRLQVDALKQLGSTVEDVGMIESRRGALLQRLSELQGQKLAERGRLEMAAIQASLQMLDEELSKRQQATQQGNAAELATMAEAQEQVRKALEEARAGIAADRRTGMQKELDEVKEKYDKLRAMAVEAGFGESEVEAQRQEAIAAVRQKYAQKEIERLKALDAELSRIRDEQRIAQLGKEEAELERIRVKYQKLEEQAKGNAKRMAEIEALRDVELDAKRAEQEQRRQEAIQRFNMELEQSALDTTNRELQNMERRHARELEMAQLHGENVRALMEQQELERQPLVEAQREAELEALGRHYDAMLERANELQLTELDIERMRGEALNAMRAQHAEEDVTIQRDKDQRILESVRQRVEAERHVVSTIQDITRDLFIAAGADQDEMADFQKAMTLFNIGLDTAAAISALTAMSEANPANAVTGGLAGVAQFVTGFARITANIAQATQLLNKAKPTAPAFAVGGSTGDAIGTWLSGSSSTGRNISTGGHVNTPTWGLFGEAGPEWVGPNWMYEHPSLAPVFAHLEYIRTTGKVPAFAEGGSTGGTGRQVWVRGYDQGMMAGNDSTSDMSMAVMKELAGAVGQLNRQLSSGIMATVSNDQLRDNQERIATIEQQANIRN